MQLRRKRSVSRRARDQVRRISSHVPAGSRTTAGAGAAAVTGLAGPQIGEGAALMALADAFDVMTASRPYSTPKPRDAALAECRELVGRQFTADAVAALEAVLLADGDRAPALDPTAVA